MYALIFGFFKTCYYVWYCAVLIFMLYTWKKVKTEDIAKWTTDPGIDYFNQIDNFWNVVYQMGQFGVCVCM